ncbi:Pimeloyl-ACP methyl ester carboxylesterase [Stigmatella aurantiaca]|uniref:Pimeloyl-ACP methyl ester carboxylesterase n=1 Tax=Stigmatella aurantiaca TaxID=41 RepID=A0A1H8F9J1_STIAU|nr:alpha/beta hydrolase [Stigmatella aurantiaca]SEN27887.1 Pimeloyl-ACP methyl ester carboxylesterase [Stigmatella aurantiaca]
MSLHVTARDEGEPAVLLHSGGMSGRQWRKLGEALAPTHRVLTPDFLGSGENPPWPADRPFHFHQDVEALSALLAGLAGPVHLVGHSYGGLIALELARKHPAQIRSLAVYDPVAFGVLHSTQDAEGLDDLSRSSAHPVFNDAERGGSETWLEVFVDYWNGPGSWRAMAPAAREAFLRVGRKVYFEVSTLLADRTPLEAYAAITAPSLLLFGEHTPAAARRVVTLLGTTIPHATVQPIAAAGHMGPLTHGGAVNAELTRHILAASAPRSP